MDEITAKKIKKISVEILIDFDAFCKKHNLKYTLSFGTLLGAVRHKGFIPWDDDIDVDMPIDDYIKFGKLWLKYGDKKKYFLQTKKTDPKIPYPFYRLRLNNTTWTEPGYETFPIHWGIPLDIFPMYNAPKSNILCKVQRKIFKYTKRWSRYDWDHKDGNKLLSKFYWLLTMIGLQSIYLINQCAKKNTCVYYPYGYPNKNHGKKEWWLPPKTLPFEGIELSVPAYPHSYLEWQYGADYMTPPPEDKRQGHAEGIIDLDHDGEHYTNCLIRNR